MTPELILMTTITFLYGIVIGSFLNVCIYRIPAGESLIKRRSHCMSCEYQLKWYDLFPVFSWILLGGRCRNCKKKISVQYPMIELINGILYVIVFYVNGFDSLYIIIISTLYCLLTSALIVLSIIDIRTFEIPFGINLFILVLGLIHLAFSYDNWTLYVIGFFAMSGLLEIVFVLSKGRAIGGGDVKLMAAAGLVIGWQKIILAFLIACIVGSVIHTVRMRVSKADRVLAMGPYLSVGILLAALWGDKWIQAYLNWIMK